MSHERKIITPQEFKAQQGGRAALIDINKRLVREIDLKQREIAERDFAIQAMNDFLTKLATIAGTPVPDGMNEGTCATKLVDRLQELVKKEHGDHENEN